MRLNTKNRLGVYSFIRSVCLLGFIGGIAGFLLNTQLDFLGRYGFALLLVALFSALILFMQGKEIFEYDSDGEVLNFRNQSSLSFLWKPANDEFPKYKLQDFDILNGLFFKKLYIRVDSRKGKNPMLRYDISYLTNQEVRDLRLSLRKVINQNMNKQNANGAKEA